MIKPLDLAIRAHFLVNDASEARFDQIVKRSPYEDMSANVSLTECLKDNSPLECMN